MSLTCTKINWNKAFSRYKRSPIPSTCRPLWSMCRHYGVYHWWILILISWLMQSLCQTLLYQSWNLIFCINCKIVVTQPPCKMDVIPRKRTKIVTLHEHAAKTYGEMAAVVGVSLATVSCVIKLKQDTGSVSPQCKGKRGHKKTMFSLLQGTMFSRTK